jgi:O-antigen ligase
MLLGIHLHNPSPTSSKQFSVWLAFGLGFSTFTPIGISYFLLGFFLCLCLSPVWRSARIPIPTGWRWIIILLIAWPAFTMVFNWQGEGWVRWLHSFRVSLCLALALTMTNRERMALLHGFLIGCAWALSVVWIHHYIHTLPEWTVWRDFLSVRGNSSSQKWILMAAGAGSCIGLAICMKDRPWQERTGLFVAGLALALMVTTHSISRNAHMVVMVLPLLLVTFRFRQPFWWAMGGTGAGVGILLMLVYAPSVSSRFEMIALELNQFANGGDFRGSVSVRAQMFVTAYHQLMAHPWMGTGLGSWEHIWEQASYRFPEMAGINNPHNDYLLWSMETGAIGGITLIALIFNLWKNSWANEFQQLSVTGWVLTWTLAITAAVNAPFRDAGLGMTMLILATALSTWRTQTNEPNQELKFP